MPEGQFSDSFNVDCRIGSLETKKRKGKVAPKVDCRIGSLEI